MIGGRGFQSTFGRVLEPGSSHSCIYLESVARLTSDGSLPSPQCPGLWLGAALLPRALCLVHPQNSEPSAGQQVLCYCHSSQMPSCIITSNSYLISQHLLLFPRCQCGSLLPGCTLMQANSSFHGEGATAGLASGTDLGSCPRPHTQKGPVRGFTLCCCYLGILEHRVLHFHFAWSSSMRCQSGQLPLHLAGTQSLNFSLGTGYRSMPASS